MSESTDKLKFSPHLRPRALECPRCEKAVIAEPKGFVVTGLDEGIWVSNQDRGVTLDDSIGRWTLYACEKEHPILTIEENLGGMFDGSSVSIDFDDDPYRMYPPQDRVLSDEIPSQLRQIHEEARACIRAKAYTAATVMSGRALEGVCELHGVKGSTLQNRLARMKDEGLIDGRLWEWADALRSVRNSAAHFTNDQVSKQDAEDTVAFTEALLDYLYVLTVRFNAFKERRAKDAAPTSHKNNQGRDNS